MKNVFALPSRLAARLGLTSRKAVVEVNGGLIDAIMLTGRKASALAEGLQSVPASYKGKPITFLYENAPRVVVHEAKDVVGADAKKYAQAYDAYKAILSKLSALTCIEFHFHADRGRVCAPETSKDGVVHIFTNCGPPGEYTDRYVSVVFGRTLREDSLSTDCRGATKGRGLVLKDGDTDVVQVLGSNWYLLMPTLSNFYPVGSREIFASLIALAWTGHRAESCRRSRPRKSATRREYGEAVGKWIDDVATVHTERITDAEKKIADLQKSLAFYYRVKREWEAMVEHFRSTPHLKEAHGRIAKDYAAIVRHPDVDSFAVVDGGLHVRTRTIDIEYKGERYAVGDFTIRLDSFGGIAVWGERPTHPEGVPHPHIAKDGIACYGNATEAITKASAYHRYGDVVELVLRWLRHGYTPELAARKIEEWRVEKPTTISNEDCP